MQLREPLRTGAAHGIAAHYEEDGTYVVEALDVVQVGVSLEDGVDNGLEFGAFRRTAPI